MRRRTPGRPASRQRSGPTTDAPIAATGEADGEADTVEETGPLRRCIVTRDRLPKERMVRFVLGPERMLVADITAGLPGRGIWLSARGDVIETARVQGALAKAFARAARGPVTIPADLVDVLEAALARRIGELLGLARRAGQAVAGFQKAREWIRSNAAALVVQAADGSPDERARLLSGAGPELVVVAPMTAAALGKVFGRDHTVHVAVAHGRLARSIGIEAGRLADLTDHRATDHVGRGGRDGLQSPGGDATGGEKMNKRAGV